MPCIKARRGEGNVKDFFNKIAKAASVYLDPYGESELKRMELADRKLDLENNKINKPFDFGDVPRKDNAHIFNHEISHAIFDPNDNPLNARKSFNVPKPKSNIGILPPDDVPPVAQAAPEPTAAQRASLVATAMADGTQSGLKAPRTARFRKTAGR